MLMVDVVRGLASLDDRREISDCSDHCVYGCHVRSLRTVLGLTSLVMMKFTALLTLKFSMVF